MHLAHSGLYDFAIGEVHDKLAGQRFHRRSTMAIDNAGTSGESAGFEQRIFHACHLLLHGTERITDHGRAHTFGAQITQFFDLEKIEKRIQLLHGKQTALLPASELSRRDAKNP
jgi:hypothetical protein